jgi:valyl-tRNA synthetase
MDKRFDPKSYESRWQQEWAAKGYFTCIVPAEPRGADAAQPYCIMIPPPNITGKLHMGHALQSTLQDLLTRWRRMQGRNALWLPGTDHAGIATQLMVERDLAKEGKSRHDLGREPRVSGPEGSSIREHPPPARPPRSSCDWTRERFTSTRASRAPRSVQRLFEEGGSPAASTS